VAVWWAHTGPSHAAARKISVNILQEDTAGAACNMLYEGVAIIAKKVVLAGALHAGYLAFAAYQRNLVARCMHKHVPSLHTHTHMHTHTHTHT